MNLIKNEPRPTFEVEKIRRGSLIRCQHKTWPEPRNGLIAYADDKLLRILWLVGVNMNASYFLIRVREVAQNEYDIWLSFDTEEILTAEMEE